MCLNNWVAWYGLDLHSTARKLNHSESNTSYVWRATPAQGVKPCGVCIYYKYIKNT